jgi:hypothetical protein
MELMVVRPITSLKGIESSKIIIIKAVTYATRHQKYQLRAAPLAPSMWPCKRKLDDKSQNMLVFAQQNGFGLSFLHMMLPPVKDPAKSKTCC